MATVIASDSTLSKLLLGAIGGVGGYFAADTIVDQATTTSASGDNVFELGKNFIQSTFGVGVDAAEDLLSGQLWWYLGAAGIGALNSVVASELTGGMVFPIVMSVAGGAGLSVVYNEFVAPPPTVGVDQQHCADGDGKGCAVYTNGQLDTSASVKNTLQNNWQYFAMGPLGIGYFAYKTFSK